MLFRSDIACGLVEHDIGIAAVDDALAEQRYRVGVGIDVPVGLFLNDAVDGDMTATGRTAGVTAGNFAGGNQKLVKTHPRLPPFSQRYFSIPHFAFFVNTFIAIDLSSKSRNFDAIFGVLYLTNGQKCDRIYCIILRTHQKRGKESMVWSISYPFRLRSSRAAVFESHPSRAQW